VVEDIVDTGLTLNYLLSGSTIAAALAEGNHLLSKPRAGWSTCRSTISASRSRTVCCGLWLDFDQRIAISLHCLLGTQMGSERVMEKDEFHRHALRRSMK